MRYEAGLCFTGKTISHSKRHHTLHAILVYSNGLCNVCKQFLVILILLTAFLFALDNPIAADIQPQIIGTFGGSIDKLP